MRSKNRYGEPIDPPLVLDFDKTTGKITAGGTRQGCRGKLLWKEIAEYLVKAKQATVEDIRLTVESDKQNILQALTMAIEAGKVQRAGTGKRSDPFLYALVAGAAPATPRKAPITHGHAGMKS